MKLTRVHAVSAAIGGMIVLALAFLLADAPRSSSR